MEIAAPDAAVNAAQTDSASKEMVTHAADANQICTENAPIQEAVADRTARAQVKNMARLLAAVALLAPATGFVAPVAPASSSALRADASGMDGIQAPTGFFDPLGLSKSASDETLAWYRAAEIKHGRVAMAAFLGCVVNGLGLEFPGAIDVNGDTFASLGSTKLPLETWDAIPASGRIQLITAIGGMEWVFEAQQPHYLRGGTPGAIRLTPGTAPWHASGYDPMGKYDAETRQKKRNMELANGRLAMLGMAGFVAAEKIPGRVAELGSPAYAAGRPSRAHTDSARLMHTQAGTMPGNPLPSTMDLSMVF